MRYLQIRPSIILVLSALLVGLTSCSSDNKDTSEYHDWQVRNDNYFEQLHQKALDSIQTAQRRFGNAWENHTNWRAYLSYSLDEEATNKSTDSIYVEILQRGAGTERPLASDSCRVFYRGRLIPSDSYTDGYVFAHSGQSSLYSEIFSRTTGVPDLRRASSYVRGFTTALLYMHVGDRWRVYIPNTLGYGSTSTTAVPAYSLLIYEIELVAFYRRGAQIPSWN